MHKKLNFESADRKIVMFSVDQFGYLLYQHDSFESYMPQ